MFDTAPLLRCIRISKMQGIEDKGEEFTDVNDLAQTPKTTQQFAIMARRLFSIAVAKD